MNFMLGTCLKCLVWITIGLSAISYLLFISGMLKNNKKQEKEKETIVNVVFSFIVFSSLMHRVVEGLILCVHFYDLYDFVLL